jgi:hypothetical protein
MTRVQTARTATFPPFLVFDGHLDGGWLPTHAPTISQYTNATGIVPRATSNTPLTDLMEAISIPDSYARILSTTLVNPGRRSPTLFKVPHHGSAQYDDVISLLYDTPSLNRFALRSAVTEPSSNTVASLLSPKQTSTAAIADVVVFLGHSNAMVAKEADEWMTKARDAARVGNLRIAYHGVYRGLDVLMKNAKWERVSAELEEICSDTYPVAFGIGALRFSSNAAERIPKWNLILESFLQAAKKKDVDVRTTFRGLVEANGAK